MAEGVKRRYDSSRRQEQAQENRRRIIVAAQALFVDKGYGRTTIADIAGAAGVAAETVYAAFRNKPTLLHRAWDVAVGGDEQDVHLLDRPEMRAVLAEPDLVTRLTRFAEVNTAIMRRTAPLLRALRGAAASEPAAAALVAEADAARLEAMESMRPPPAPGGSLSPRRSAATCCGPRRTARCGTAWSSSAGGPTTDTPPGLVGCGWQCWSRTTRGRSRVRDRAGHTVTVTGLTFQISSQYSAMARSDENFALRAVLRIDIRDHTSGFCQAALTRS